MGVTSGTIDATIPASVSEGNGYRVRVVADKPSLKASDNGSDITIKKVTSIAKSNRAISEINLFPNPADTYFVVKNNQLNGEINITISDLTGKEINNYTSSIGKKNSITHLKNGVYIITVNYETQNKRFRLVVE
jgi:hypothetical protein